MLLHHPQKVSTIDHKTPHNKGPENFEYGPSSGHTVTSFHSFYLFLTHPGTEIISHKHLNSYFIENSSAKMQLSQTCIQTCIQTTVQLKKNLLKCDHLIITVGKYAVLQP